MVDYQDYKTPRIAIDNPGWAREISEALHDEISELLKSSLGAAARCPATVAPVECHAQA
jgi:hypothetical protein